MSSDGVEPAASVAVNVLAAITLIYLALFAMVGVLVVVYRVGRFVSGCRSQRGRAEVRAAMEAATAKAVPDLVPAQREGEK